MRSIRCTSGCATIALVASRGAHGLALAALLRVGQRPLGRGLGDPHALQGDAEPRRVHHREHAGEALVLLPDQPAGGAAPVAERHGAGRRGVDAELVLDAGAAEIVGRPVRQDLRDQEQGDAPRAGGRIREPGQHEVDDVVGEIMLAVGDVDLAAGDPVGAVARRLGPGPQQGEVGAGLRLGQVHGGGPFARDELLQVAGLQVVGAVGRQRLDPALGQQRAEAEGEAGAVPHLGAGGLDQLRQPLAAVIGLGGEPVPSALREGSVRLPPARRGGDASIRERGAVPVADPVERRDHAGGDPPGLGQDRLGVLGIDRVEPGHVPEGEEHLRDRGAVTHTILPRRGPAGGSPGAFDRARPPGLRRPEDRRAGSASPTPRRRLPV